MFLHLGASHTIRDFWASRCGRGTYKALLDHAVECFALLSLVRLATCVLLRRLYGGRY